MTERPVTRCHTVREQLLYSVIIHNRLALCCMGCTKFPIFSTERKMASPNSGWTGSCH